MSLTRSARGTLENPGQGVTIKAAANRTMLEQTWGEFAQILTYKAEGAGMSVVRVDPAYTSLTCSRCGVAQFDASRQERNRIRFRCPDCGNDLNRSVNAAKNILVRGLAEPALSAEESVIAGRDQYATINGGDVRRAPGKPRQYVVLLCKERSHKRGWFLVKSRSLNDFIHKLSCWHTDVLAFWYNDGMATAHVTFQERAYLRRSGHRRLDEAFRECARLYNAALEHWQTAWKHGHSVSLYEQCRELTAIRHDDAYWGGVGVQVGRGVLRRLDRARQAFYRRCKAGEKPGYPRFRSSRRWKTIEIAQPIASMVTNKRGKWVVKVKGLPILVIKPRRDLPDST